MSVLPPEFLLQVCRGSEGSHDFCSDNLPGTRAVSLFLQIESDSVEVFPQSQAGVPLEQRSSLQPLLLPQTGLQVSELLMQCSAELVQEALVPRSGRAHSAEELEGVLGHLVEHRDGLSLLQLAATQRLLGEGEVIPVLQAGGRGDPPQLL